MKTRSLVSCALVAGAYTALSLAGGSLSFYFIQLRFAEVLMGFCLFDKRYIVPLTLGCFLSDLLAFIMGLDLFVIDLVIGPLATLIAGCLMYCLRKMKYPALLMPALINGLLIGLEFAFCLDNPGMFVYYGLYIAAGELVSVFVPMLFLYRPFKSLSDKLMGL